MHEQQPHDELACCLWLVFFIVCWLLSMYVGLRIMFGN